MVCLTGSFLSSCFFVFFSPSVFFLLFCFLCRGEGFFQNLFKEDNEENKGMAVSRFYKGVHIVLFVFSLLALLVHQLVPVQVQGRELPMLVGLATIVVGSFFLAFDLILNKRVHFFRFVFEFVLLWVGSYFLSEHIRKVMLVFFHGKQWMIIVVYALLCIVFLLSTRRKRSSYSLGKRQHSKKKKEIAQEDIDKLLKKH